MAGLGAAGALDANLFFAGTAAHDVNDRVIYNAASGALSDDSNGNLAGGALLAILVGCRLPISWSFDRRLTGQGLA